MTTWMERLKVIGLGLVAAVIGFLALQRWQAGQQETQAVNSLLNIVGYNLQIGVLKPLPAPAPPAAPLAPKAEPPKKE